MVGSWHGDVILCFCPGCFDGYPYRVPEESIHDLRRLWLHQQLRRQCHVVGACVYLAAGNMPDCLLLLWYVTSSVVPIYLKPVANMSFSRSCTLPSTHVSKPVWRDPPRIKQQDEQVEIPAPFLPQLHHASDHPPNPVLCGLL